MASELRSFKTQQKRDEVFVHAARETRTVIGCQAAGKWRLEHDQKAAYPFAFPSNFKYPGDPAESRSSFHDDSLQSFECSSHVTFERRTLTYWHEEEGKEAENCCTKGRLYA